MKATEVTQGEWQALMGNNPSKLDECGPDCPVENVKWWEALAFANAMSRKDGLPECYTASV
jgi:formylglycine-generating enzyme required for sulfatase activity